ncbi:hypothetical protein HMPREF0766_13802 [Sphingobacterium spiritivorum ATCC 33861]|uniref:Uncharacterized protein n=1 Tax=Sphingobacterium spiritivorum ATCC 33861 TaxID=525373 RepID=D7VS48_SPHSI|nr:hypothetical protein HMPREF0766_13802 [Sphingobacterium spiritivorum ATCC 33861]
MIKGFIVRIIGKFGTKDIAGFREYGLPRYASKIEEQRVKRLFHTAKKYFCYY